VCVCVCVCVCKVKAYKNEMKMPFRTIIIKSSTGANKKEERNEIA
jgi:hypothetical protein